MPKLKGANSFFLDISADILKRYCLKTSHFYFYNNQTPRQGTDIFATMESIINSYYLILFVSISRKICHIYWK